MTNNTQDRVRELVEDLRYGYGLNEAADIIEKLAAISETLRSCKVCDVGVWHTDDQHELILVSPKSVAETIERTFKEVLGDE